jgi:hypothetical protein
MITQERLKELVAYDPVTGIFTWTKDRRAGRNNAFLVAKAGERAGFGGGYGYRYILIETRREPEHRWACLYMLGEFPAKGIDIDHINGHRADNSWANIRRVTRSENMQNLKGAHKDSMTGWLGVERKRGKFAARICINRKKLSLGCYDTPEQAHAAYLTEKRKIHEKGTL